ncbi:hypothetical protein RRX38_24700 (plasmid) [Pseudomonas sp. DTU_2021_1001937_2_SI_NGA_ILE_001]|uniref:class I SAM-dependent methyltransferase n=1 Tax=Pseudomonas sp. DTU_2021_1001937_2_SI_NGA_ILE_001 TaxID=3077589 RepID=UPI0028FC2B48|nr:class I SAM-dependent methyltransferase [Pseudomonas sp. DTU_2021_1001937_2_SI_NGA_ILE_001]WNW14380.1 hypothetical protein RRX38_24700 [Pseudomonas sp. DTU_2021_1001937_2_SI_NGA_ILE_001]
MSEQHALQQALQQAGERLGCDKVIPHGYHVHYARHLLHWWHQPLRLLEIGIGGEDRELGGASLNMWHQVFEQAELYGLDIYPKQALDRPRLQTFVIDQGDPAALREFARQHGPFDVIIDDGSHRRSDQLASLFNLIEHVRPGGYYILEDYFTAYWPVYDGSTLARDFLDTPVRWLKQTIDIININNLLSEQVRRQVPNWKIDALHVYPGIAFIGKSHHSPPSEIPNEHFLLNQIELDELRYGIYKQLFFTHSRDPMQHLEALLEIKKWVDASIQTADEALKPKSS